MAVPLVGMITVFVPVSPSWAKSPLWRTVRFTVRLEAGAGLAVTVKRAGSPSVTADLAGSMLTVGAFTVMVNVCRADRLPSLAVTVTDTVPTSPDRGVPEKVRLLVVKLSQAGKVVPSAFAAV